MKSTLFVSAFLAVASLVGAAPTSNTIEERSQEPQTLFPDTMIQIWEQWPDHAFGDTDWGVVSRRNGKENAHTLMSIHIPKHLDGRTCRYSFFFPYNLDGSMSAQLFTVIGKIPHDATWNKRPSRDRHLATIQMSKEKASDPKGAQITHYGGDTFTCQGGTTLHLELIPVGDNDYVAWYIPYGFAVIAGDWPK